MRVTIKSDIIKVGYNLPRIFTCSIYYTKHVYLFITAADNMTWTAKQWYKANKVFLKIYHSNINIIDYYNYGM